MELQKFKKILLSASATSLVLMSACSKEPTTQDDKSKKTPVTSTITKHAVGCTETPTAVLPSTAKKIDMPVVVPSKLDAWKTSIGIIVAGDTARVIQMDGSGKPNEQPLDPMHPYAVSEFDLTPKDGHANFVDPFSGTKIDVRADPSRDTTPKVPFMITFCPPPDKA